MNLLIIEPFTEMRVMLRSAMRALQAEQIYEPKTSYDGIYVLATSPIDIVICAHEAKPFDGILFARMIRNAAEAPVRQVRAILIVDGYDETACARAHAEGADGLLRKPFSYDDVQALVRRILRNRAAFLEFKTYTGPCRRRQDLPLEQPERRNSQARPHPGKYPHKLANIAQRIMNVREKKARSALSEREKVLQQRGVLIDGNEGDIITLPVDALQVGMLVADAIKTDNGTMVIPSGTALAVTHLKRLKDLLSMGRIKAQANVIKASPEATSGA